MTKIFVQDIVPSGKRSIRNIPLPVGRGDASGIKAPRQTTRAEQESTEARTPRKPRTEKSAPESRESREPRGRQKSRLGLWVSAVVGLIVIAFAASFMFVSATVTVTPRETKVPINISGAAALSPEGSTELTYTLVTLTREGSKQVPAGTEEKVERKATGKIVIYNNYNSSPQTLIANTRFESPTGLIYRIQSQVIVPGTKTSNGTITPGSVTATVVADQAGEKYNIGLADFTIPGFKGDPRYSKFSAKSDPKTPIAGGFVGTEKKVTAADTAAAKVSIETQLKNELQDLIESQIPETHVLFKGATTFDFNSLPQEAGSSTSMATIREEGSVYGILFDRAELSKFLAARLTDISGKDVQASNLESLDFTLDNMSTFDPKTTQKITFKLSGNADFVWNIDNNRISTSLAGQKRANIKGILANFEAIDRANVSLSPMWVLSLPKKAEKIKIELENEA